MHLRFLCSVRCSLAPEKAEVWRRCALFSLIPQSYWLTFVVGCDSTVIPVDIHSGQGVCFFLVESWSNTCVTKIWTPPLPTHAHRQLFQAVIFSFSFQIGILTTTCKQCTLMCKPAKCHIMVLIQSMRAMFWRQCTIWMRGMPKQRSNIAVKLLHRAWLTCKKDNLQLEKASHLQDHILPLLLFFKPVPQNYCLWHTGSVPKKSVIKSVKKRTTAKPAAAAGAPSKVERDAIRAESGLEPLGEWVFKKKKHKPIVEHVAFFWALKRIHFVPRSQVDWCWNQSIMGIGGRVSGFPISRQRKFDAPASRLQDHKYSQWVLHLQGTHTSSSQQQ